MPPEILDAVARQRAALLRADEAAQREMARQWLQVERNLSGKLDALTLELSGMEGPIPLWRLGQLERYQSLMTQVNQEMTRYAGTANGLVTAQQRAMAGMALENSTALVQAVAQDAGVSVGFNTLPTAAVENMIGLSGDGSPLRAILADASRVGPQAMADALVRGVALGYNPRKTARLAMRDGLGQTYTRSLTIARTESLRAYREASRSNYLANSDVVTSYKRLSAKDRRTCLSCLALDGQEYPLTEPLAEHPNGRCTLIPMVKGLPNVQWKTGQEWFAEQSEDVQREMMGPYRHDLWKSGEAQWSDMVHIHDDPVWGASPRVTTVRELLSR